MKKVVLINLPSSWLISDRDMPPLGILSIAAYLREQDVEVEVYDLAGMPAHAWHIPYGDIYGFSVVTPQVAVAGKVTKLLKTRQPNAVVVAGGIHPTVLPAETLQDTGVDVVVVGEGERVMYGLTRDLSVIPDYVPPPVIRETDLLEVTRLPRPAWDMVDFFDYAQIRTNSFLGPTRNNREGYVQTSRGCPYHCAFCAQHNITRRRVRYRTLTQVITEIEWKKETFGCDRFYIFDDTFTLDKQRVKDFCRLIRQIPDIDWHCLGRTDLADASLYETMQEAGCKGICYGIESGSDLILNRMNKGTDKQTNLRAIQIAKEAGLKVRAQIIVGFPGETWHTVLETGRFIEEAPADVWGLHYFVPYPGSDVWENPEKYGVEFSRDFSKYHTIGRPGEVEPVLNGNTTLVKNYYEFLRKVVGDKDISFHAELKCQAN